MFIEVIIHPENVATILLNRPEKMNALNIEMMKEFSRKLFELEKDEKIRVVVIMGEGSAFCTGLDLNEVNVRDLVEESADILKTLLLRIYLSSKITIASIHGIAIAGGAGIMSVCDIIVAESKSQIGFPEVKRGLVPAIIMAFLRRKIPEGILRNLLLLGRIVTAQEAKEIGLIHYIVENRESFMPKLIQEALLSAPGAVFHTKNMLESFHLRGIDEDVKMAEKIHRMSRESAEAVEGINAFFEKRDPHWK